MYEIRNRFLEERDETSWGKCCLWLNPPTRFICEPYETILEAVKRTPGNRWASDYYCVGEIYEENWIG
jgi:hypothetical protein